MTKSIDEAIAVDEGTLPPSTKIMLQVSIDKDLIEQLKMMYAEARKEAEAKDETAPNWSQFNETLLRKGLRSYRASREKKRE